MMKHPISKIFITLFTIVNLFILSKIPNRLNEQSFYSIWALIITNIYIWLMYFLFILNKYLKGNFEKKKETLNIYNPSPLKSYIKPSIIILSIAYIGILIYFYQYIYDLQILAEIIFLLIFSNIPTILTLFLIFLSYFLNKNLFLKLAKYFLASTIFVYTLFHLFLTFLISGFFFGQAP